MPRSRYLNYKSKDKSYGKSNVVDLQNIVIDYNMNGHGNGNTSDHLSDQNFILGIGSEPIDSDGSSDNSSYRENDFDEEAWKFSGFLFDKDYLKEVEIETGDEYETENRGVQASTSA